MVQGIRRQRLLSFSASGTISRTSSQTRHAHGPHTTHQTPHHLTTSPPYHLTTLPPHTTHWTPHTNTRTHQQHQQHQHQQQNDTDTTPTPIPHHSTHMQRAARAVRAASTRVRHTRAHSSTFHTGSVTASVAVRAHSARSCGATVAASSMQCWLVSAGEVSRVVLWDMVTQAKALHESLNSAARAVCLHVRHVLLVRRRP